MGWYAANLVRYLKFERGPQDCFLTWEDVCLISASNWKGAKSRAEKMGRSRQNDPGTTVWDGRPGHWVFVGVRQLIEVPPANNRGIEDGAEVSFSKLLVRRREDFKRVVRGDTVVVWSASITDSIERALSKSPKRIPYVEF